MQGLLWLLMTLLMIVVADDDHRCPFRMKLANGSEWNCWDDECSNGVDPTFLEIGEDCRTNYLSLKFVSSSSYQKFLSNVTSLSSFFRPGRPHLERLLQIEILSPLTNNEELFTIDHWNHLLLNDTSPSNIDTYELIFNDRLTTDEGVQLRIDGDSFISVEQKSIDTLRIHFHCSKDLIVEWELVKSLSSLPRSPCPEQIDYLLLPNFHSPLRLRILLLLSLSLLVLIVVVVVLGCWIGLDRRSLIVVKEIEEELIERF